MKIFTRKIDSPQCGKSTEIVAEMHVNDFIGKQAGVIADIIMRNVTESIARRFVEEHYEEITAAIDVADVAKRIGDRLVTVISEEMRNVIEGGGAARESVLSRIQSAQNRHNLGLSGLSGL